ncbi:hypothetical protein ASPBRDRAFT_43048 [Aspergillus brasiliensis CBS 101740]|uniref:Uncharacterized protein n=1 Tax=Aspergillus brasiliensis (strain CBS 101740 / IMI 381727 / IBT 21946) TaxID=767769 RepID=A0A1L9UJ16_ASPBC|nr:hypothetical protein ASPBRDRAFT_43048 [Aspergillus brasiliensis CBS 101740]
MFRNALRQSSRTVAAASATGRIASVSPIPVQVDHTFAIWPIPSQEVISMMLAIASLHIAMLAASL